MFLEGNHNLTLSCFLDWKSNLEGTLSRFLICTGIHKVPLSYFIHCNSILKVNLSRFLHRKFFLDVSAPRQSTPVALWACNIYFSLRLSLCHMDNSNQTQKHILHSAARLVRVCTIMTTIYFVIRPWDSVADNYLQVMEGLQFCFSLCNSVLLLHIFAQKILKFGSKVRIIMLLLHHSSPL